jgi:hypothetical protein
MCISLVCMYDYITMHGAKKHKMIRVVGKGI